MNAYTTDGMRWLKRASSRITDPMPGTEDMEGYFYPSTSNEQDDSILFFAFGIEKLLKGLLYDINPLFIYEESKIVDLAGILYCGKLVVGAKNAYDQRRKDGRINRDVLAGGKSLSYAANFSQVANDFNSRIRELFDYRGAVAHQEPSEIGQDAMRFLRKNFSLIVEAFVAELRLNPNDVFAPGRREALKSMSDYLIAKDNYAAKLRDLAKQHLAIWKKIEDDPIAVKNAVTLTDLDMGKKAKGGKFKELVACPACEQFAVYLCDISYDAMRTEEVPVGAFVVGIKCHYCGLEISKSEDIDYFQLDARFTGSYWEE